MMHHRHLFRSPEQAQRDAAGAALVIPAALATLVWLAVSIEWVLA